LLDVGSGGGLPGIPVAIVQPERQVTLLDSNHKKGTFLRQAVMELELGNTAVAVERIEDHRPPLAYEVVISRAFSDLADFVKLAAHLCKPESGKLAAMKGIYPHEELSQLPSQVAVEKIVPIAVPGLAAERHLVMINQVDSRHARAF
jgi:16S rRNA (guanine527-N7)-methyltransferase